MSLTSDLTVQTLTPQSPAQQRLAWDQYVEQAAGASFFHLSGWQLALEDVWRHPTHYLYAQRDGRIVGVLPLAHVRSRLFGNALSSLPFCVYAGPIADDDAALAALNDAAVKLGQQLGVPHLEYRSVAKVHDDWPTQDLYVTFRKPISANHDDNMKAIPRKQRAMVRKALGRELSAGVGDVDTFFALYADNVHRHGTPAMSKAWFARLAQLFGDRAEFWIVRDPQGQPVSGVMSFYWRNEVLPYYAGDLEAARALAANDFKYWTLMCHAADKGVTLFDYGRSKRDTGSFDFKKNWGFEAAPLHYQYKLYQGQPIPQNNPSNPKYRALIATWRKLPRPVVNWLGPKLTRALG